MSLVPNTLTPQQKQEMYELLVHGTYPSTSKVANRVKAVKKPVPRKRKSTPKASEPPKKKIKSEKKTTRVTTLEGVSKKKPHSTSRHRRSNI